MRFDGDRDPLVESSLKLFGRCENARGEYVTPKLHGTRAELRHPKTRRCRIAGRRPLSGHRHKLADAFGPSSAVRAGYFGARSLA